MLVLLEVDPADPNADILTDFEQPVRARMQANAVGDPSYPALLASVQGEALQRVQASIEARRSQGQRALFEGRIARVEVVERSGTTTTLRSCVVDSGRLVDANTGQRLDDGRVTLNASTNVFVLVDGTWKFDQRIASPDAAICDGVTP